MMVTEKFTLDGFYLVYCDFLKNPQLVKASSMEEAKEIFDEYWYWDMDYMDIRMGHIYGVKKAEPYLSDVCKHILYTWFHIAYKNNLYHKYEMIPGKWDVQQAQLFSRIIRKEFIHTFDNGIKEVDIELDFEDLFNRYSEAQNIYANNSVFKQYFERFYERYGNENRVVKVHDKDNFINVVKQYYKL